MSHLQLAPAGTGSRRALVGAFSLAALFSSLLASPGQPKKNEAACAATDRVRRFPIMRFPGSSSPATPLYPHHAGIQQHSSLVPSPSCLFLPVRLLSPALGFIALHRLSHAGGNR